MFCKDVIRSYNSLEEIPTASGLPTPGANAGSSTSISKLTYRLSKVDTASFSNLTPLPERMSLSDTVNMLCSRKNASSSLTNARAPT